MISVAAEPAFQRQHTQLRQAKEETVTKQLPASPSRQAGRMTELGFLLPAAAGGRWQNNAIAPVDGSALLGSGRGGHSVNVDASVNARVRAAGGVGRGARSVPAPADPLAFMMQSPDSR